MLMTSNENKLSHNKRLETISYNNVPDYVTIQTQKKYLFYVNSFVPFH